MSYPTTTSTLTLQQPQHFHPPSGYGWPMASAQMFTHPSSLPFTNPSNTPSTKPTRQLGGGMKRKRKAAQQAVTKLSVLRKKEEEAKAEGLDDDEEEWYSSEDDDPDDADVENPTHGSQGYAIDDGFVEKEDVDHRNDDDWSLSSDIDDDDDDVDDEFESLRKKIQELEKENKRLRTGRNHWREAYLKLQNTSSIKSQ